MLHRIPRIAKVAILAAAVLLAAPAASLLQGPHHASSSALDNPLTGVTYACTMSVCKHTFPSGPVYCFSNNDTSDCWVDASGCHENPCD